ncbi:radical SAM protein [candidate division KSB1 bacterium]
MFEPGYINLSRSGELEKRAEELEAILKDCVLCPHECHVNRINDDLGTCNAPGALKVSSAFPHYGEERPLVGLNGSGTIFMTFCSMQCVFCQNSEISHEGEGQVLTIDEMASAMLSLQNLGCHNINFVTPTHYVPQIIRSVYIAAERGLKVPLVYNTSGYDSLDTLKLLDGIIDIYMPDAKFAENSVGEMFTQAADYSDRMFDALKEMHRQVGDLSTNPEGIAERGMLIRHLVMPGGLAGTDKMMKFIAEELSENTYVNIMGQYRPCFLANNYPELSRTPSREEMRKAKETARNYGLHRGF